MSTIYSHTKQTLYKANERGRADYGWLKTHYSFSFSNYYDPSKINFGVLRVLNDDYIAGGGGFPTHPHANMEIITIPLEGDLAHRDSTGKAEVIRSGDVQVMSAGRGIEHSEFNHSKTNPVRLFQIWVFPKIKNTAPAYGQKHFSEAQRVNQFQWIISPEDAPIEGSLTIKQDAYFALLSLEAGKSLTYEWQRKGNGLYALLIEGSAQIEGQDLTKRDALTIENATHIQLKAQENSQWLLMEVPMSL
ncbi:MAG: pirin family protein [Bernardetiaceae bacterium]|nr:pirin family protein [Bernardetiaceae bacterium]